MSKKMQYIGLLSLVLGQLILCVSRILRGSLSDFALGFCEGSSIVFITIGTIYMVWCFIKRKNPYKIEKRR